MSARRRWIRRLALAAPAVVLLLPAAHLLRTAWQDRPNLGPLPPGHADDASRLAETRVRETWPVPSSAPEAERQLVELLARARREHLPVAIAGARHSMGGHTLAPDGIVVDMRALHAMSLSADGTVLTVEAGTLWAEVIPFLDAHGRAVAVMQSDSSFSVGGTLSVNAHGWSARCPPIASTVKSFRLLTADGAIRRCSRTENPDLFSLALGGYGLFGIILGADLATVPNEWYYAVRRVVPLERYAEIYRQRVDAVPAAQMAYGRLTVTRADFLRDVMLSVHERVAGGTTALPPITPSRLDPLRRLVFRGSLGSDFGKQLRWSLERVFGEKLGGERSSRNQLMSGSVSLYVNRRQERTDVLHEYFVPPARLTQFLGAAREIVPRYGADLLNVTLRDVRRDDDTVLRYADQDMVALVFFFDQLRTPEAEARMTALTRELIDASLAAGGRYYLPYRPHATDDQFLRAYPQAPRFLAAKRRYDPGDVFQNQFYLRYRYTRASSRGGEWQRENGRKAP